MGCFLKARGSREYQPPFEGQLRGWTIFSRKSMLKQSTMVRWHLPSLRFATSEFMRLHDWLLNSPCIILPTKAGRRSDFFVEFFPFISSKVTWNNCASWSENVVRQMDSRENFCFHFSCCFRDYQVVWINNNFRVFPSNWTIRLCLEFYPKYFPWKKSQNWAKCSVTWN